MKVENPCVKLCKFDARGMCLGCFRDKAEVKGWKRLGEAERSAVLERIRPLVALHPAGKDSAGRRGKERKRLKKLDRRIARLERKLAEARSERARQTAVAA
ncbi:DUF1289 domain-containing protein [Rhodospirillum centenum]|uniref:Conserved domain protein n=1 Tax=Rhodospirillum centenum (strain ATCC 51521 / SW) TaxID=414684 RepID=B6IPC3_RHOCS|nr:DUF1289 domain-containing protein [Rhodospirillum centenum]ACI99625.1 conserved domain protein [Rhodospirillum centenum SW]